METLIGILVTVFLVALYIFFTANRLETNIKTLMINIMIGAAVIIILILIFF